MQRKTLKEVKETMEGLGFPTMPSVLRMNPCSICLNAKSS